MAPTVEEHSYLLCLQNGFSAPLLSSDVQHLRFVAVVAGAGFVRRSEPSSVGHSTNPTYVFTGTKFTSYINGIYV